MANEFVARKGIISIGVISGSGNLDIIGSGVIGGNLIVGGTLTAQEFRAELVSSSIIYESGSTKFGDTLDDEHQRTGSYFISGTAFTVTSSNFNLLGSFNQNGTSTISGQLNVDQVRLDDSTVTTNDASNLTLSTNVGSNSGTIVINHSADGNIVLTPNGTGIVDIKKGLTISGSTILGDSTSDSVTFNTGINTSPGFTSGFTGGGWRLSYSNTSSSLELDNLTVRGTMKIFELLINQIRATNGTLFVSSVGKVETVTGTSPTFFLSFDTGSGGTLGHGFDVGDVIRAQRVNPGNPSSFVYRSDLTVTGVSANGKFVTASLQGSTTAPSGGMEFVRLGNTSSLSNRQGTVYLTADDTNAPFIDVIDGVASHADWNAASGSNRLKTRMGKLNGITSTNFGALSGYGFYASGSAYLEGGINAAFGKIANWEITTGAITSSNVHISSSQGGVFKLGETLPTSHTSGNGIFLSGSGQALIGSASGHRIQFDGSNLILSSSTFLLGNTSNFVSGSGGNIRISGSNVQIQTPSFYLGGANQFISGSGGDIEISSSNFHLLNGNITASNATLSGTITANTGQIGGWTIEPDRLYASSSVGGLFLSASERSIVMRSGSKESLLIGESVNFTGTLDEFTLTSNISSSISASSELTSYEYFDDPGDRTSTATVSYINVSLPFKLLGTITPSKINIPINFSFSSSLVNNASVVQTAEDFFEDTVSQVGGTTYTVQLRQGGTVIGSSARTITEGTLISSSVEVTGIPTSLSTVEVYVSFDGSIDSSTNQLPYFVRFSSNVAKQYRPVTFINSDGVFSKISPTTTISLLNVGSATTISTGGGGGGGISSIIAGAGLTGGTITTTGTITVNSGSMLPFYSSSIFSTVSGDITINAGGTASIAANSVALGTDTTGDYVATITAGTGIDTTGATTGETIAHTISVDVSDFMSNGVDNRVVTATGADAMNAEANLTFDGTALAVTGNLTTTGNTTLGNATSDAHTVTGSLGISGSFNILQSAYGAQISSSIANTVNAVVASISTGSFNGVFFDYTIGLSTTGRRVGTVLATWLPGGTNVEFTDFSTLDMGATGGVSMAADISAGNIRLRANNTSGATVEVRTITRAI